VDKERKKTLGFSGPEDDKRFKDTERFVCEEKKSVLHTGLGEVEGMYITKEKAIGGGVTSSKPPQNGQFRRRRVGCERKRKRQGL